MPGVVLLSVVKLNVGMVIIIMLGVIVPNIYLLDVIILSVIMLNVFILGVVLPKVVAPIHRQVRIGYFPAGRRRRGCGGGPGTETVVTSENVDWLPERL